MEHSRYQLFVSFVSTAVLAVIACALRTIALFVAFDREPGYFRSGALLPILYYTLAAVSLVWFASYFFRVKKGASAPLPSAGGNVAFFGNTLAAAAFAATGVLLILSSKTGSAPTVVPTLAAVLLLAGCVYFLLPLFGKEEGSAPLLGGYALIFGAALLLCTTYFDRYTPMNAPHKVAGHLALLSLMLVLLTELREKIGRGLPRAGAVAAMVSFFLCFTAGASGMLAFFGGVYNDLLYFAVDLCLLAFSVYLAARGAGMLFPSAPEKEPIAGETEAGGAGLPVCGAGTDDEEPAADAESRAATEPVADAESADDETENTAGTAGGEEDSDPLKKDPG